MSQAEAATKLGVDSGTVSRWERSKHGPPSYALPLLAALYGKPVEFFGEEAARLGEIVPRGTPRSSAGGPGPLRTLEEVQTWGEQPIAREPSTTSYQPRHARNLPLGVREYLAEFHVRLVKGGASEDEIDEAMALLRSPDVFSYFKGGKLAEYNEEDVLDGMRSLAEDVVIPRLQKLGRKVK